MIVFTCSFFCKYKRRFGGGGGGKGLCWPVDAWICIVGCGAGGYARFDQKCLNGVGGYHGAGVEQGAIKLI